MEWILANYEKIVAVIIQVISLVVATTSFIKVLSSEKRTVSKLSKFENDVAITRAGIVQAFKESIVTKDVKVSVNNQVKKVLHEELEILKKEIRNSEERRTKMNFWVLKILSWTAAANKLTLEQQTDINELLALIAEEEQIVETL